MVLSGHDTVCIVGDERKYFLTSMLASLLLPENFKSSILDTMQAFSLNEVSA